MEFSTTTPPSPAATVRRILLSYLADKATFMAAAEAMAREECFMEILGRFLALHGAEEFDLFFSFLSRRAPDLISPCHWLAFGVRLAQGQRAPKMPTFEQLQRVLRLVREERPQLEGFLLLLVAGSVLGKVAGVRTVGFDRGPTGAPVVTRGAVL